MWRLIAVLLLGGVVVLWVVRCPLDRPAANYAAMASGAMVQASESETNEQRFRAILALCDAFLEIDVMSRSEGQRRHARESLEAIAREAELLDGRLRGNYAVRSALHKQYEAELERRRKALTDSSFMGGVFPEGDRWLADARGKIRGALSRR